MATKLVQLLSFLLVMWHIERKKCSNKTISRKRNALSIFLININVKTFISTNSPKKKEHCSYRNQ